MKFHKVWLSGFLSLSRFSQQRAARRFLTRSSIKARNSLVKPPTDWQSKDMTWWLTARLTARCKGKPEYEYVWKGAKWLFASPENRERFAASPETFEPEYGGYCAWSLSEGTVMEADPEVWKIVDGKLYLIQNDMVKEVWEKSEPSLIEKSNENWRQMMNK
jgi:YHS domain-containing protein